jgi:hypothetical protein
MDGSEADAAEVKAVARRLAVLVSKSMVLAGALRESFTISFSG